MQGWGKSYYFDDVVAKAGSDVEQREIVGRRYAHVLGMGSSFSSPTAGSCAKNFSPIKFHGWRYCDADEWHCARISVLPHNSHSSMNRKGSFISKIHVSHSTTTLGWLSQEGKATSSTNGQFLLPFNRFRRKLRKRLSFLPGLNALWDRGSFAVAML